MNVLKGAIDRAGEEMDESCLSRVEGRGERSETLRTFVVLDGDENNDNNNDNNDNDNNNDVMKAPEREQEPATTSNDDDEECKGRGKTCS